MKPDLDWHASLDAGPGVTWRPPRHVVLDPELTAMRPRPRRDYFTPSGGVEWAAGEAIVEEPWRGASPCVHLSWRVYEAPTAEEVAALTLAALLTPGTRSDYLEAVRFGTT